MKKTEYYLLAGVVIHLILPFLLGSIIGNYLAGLFRTNSNGFNYLFVILFCVISLVLFTKSFRNTDGRYYNAVIIFGKWGGLVGDGLQYLPFGFLKNSVKIAQYTKGVFGIKRNITVEHNNGGNLFDYQMELEYNLNLEFNRASIAASLEKFFEQGNEDSLTQNVFDEKDKQERQWLTNIVKDVNTTLEQIALAFGFDYLKKHNDWTLGILKIEYRAACKENDSIKHSHDTLEATLEKYGIDLINMNTQVRLESEIEKIVKQKKIKEFEGEAKIVEAEKAQKVREIQARATATATKIEGKASIQIQAQREREVGFAKADAKKAEIIATKDGYEITVDMLRDKTFGDNNEKLDAYMVAQIAGLMADLHGNEMLYTVGGPDGRPLKDDLTAKALVVASEVMRAPREKRDEIFKKIEQQEKSKK